MAQSWLTISMPSGTARRWKQLGQEKSFETKACAGSRQLCREAAHLSLAGHFSAVWVHRVPPDNDQVVTVAPDGCIDLQWVDGRLRIAGPDREAVAKALTLGATIVGFRPDLPPARPMFMGYARHGGWHRRRP